VMCFDFFFLYNGTLTRWTSESSTFHAPNLRANVKEEH
jgi:hypothetical protein